MKKISTFLLIAVGLLNLFPVIGVISADQLTELYGVGVESPDLQTLMRHRAVLLGLLGGFLLFAAHRSSLQLPAAIAGLVSMSSFVVLAILSGEIGPELNSIVLADIVGSVAIAVVLLVLVKDRRDAA